MPKSISIPFYYLMIVALLLVACEKEVEEVPTQTNYYHKKFIGDEYYVRGTITDTSGASLKGKSVYGLGCGVSGCYQTLEKNGGYLVKWRSWWNKNWDCEPGVGFDIRISEEDSLVHSITVDPDTLIPFDTVQIDLFF